ncbi:MAG: hypothetical protein IJK27_00240 [Bacilli bacterium]|nr:hypothetical protein [Bacilli bacterium]
MENLKFYGHDVKNIKPINDAYSFVISPQHLYELMTKVWDRFSCAPKYRNEWSKENMTLGQCSITAFLVQDIFGGEVRGVKLPDGGYHCFNVVDGQKFDLTSEQFGDTELDYENCPEQKRVEHFASQEKFERYLYIRNRLFKLNK